MDSLFSQMAQQSAPLAERLRPQSLPRNFRTRASSRTISKTHRFWGNDFFVLWGPPELEKNNCSYFRTPKDAHFEPFSAVSEGVKRIREIAEEIEKQTRTPRKKNNPLCRWNYALKKKPTRCSAPLFRIGNFYLIGATTENPSFSLNSALLREFVFSSFVLFSENALRSILEHAKHSSGREIEKAEDFLIAFSNGDARTLLNLLEAAFSKKRGW